MQLGIEEGISAIFHIDTLISSVDVASGADNIERAIIKEYKNKIVHRITTAGTASGPPEDATNCYKFPRPARPFPALVTPHSNSQPGSSDDHI